MEDHDHVFKELLGEFFPEFIDLFFPQVSAYLDRQSIEFQPQEIFADLTEGDTYEADVVVKARFLNPIVRTVLNWQRQNAGFSPLCEVKQQRWNAGFSRHVKNCPEYC
jgi:hypothetical protein